VRLNYFLVLSVFFFTSCTDYNNISVIEVIDGDTIRLSNNKVLRYIGIDTPESRIKEGSEFIYDPQPFSVQAAQKNKDLVLGKKIRVEFDLVKTDKYGRLLGYCFYDGMMVNEELLKNGLAVLMTIPPNIKYTDRFIKAQTDARNQGRGLWAENEIVSDAQASDYIDQVRTVRGRVIRTFKSDKCIYLNFGADYRTDFTIVIFKKSLRSFIDKKIDPENYYMNKMVEVTGRIKQYNGPEIIVGHPSQITVLSY